MTLHTYLHLDFLLLYLIAWERLNDCMIRYYNVMWCDVIWYDMIWYDMIWYDMIWYDMIWYDMIWYDMIYDMIWYDMIWYDMIWYDMIWYDMIWYDMIWYDMMIWYNVTCGPFYAFIAEFQVGLIIKIMECRCMISKKLNNTFSSYS